MRTLKGGALDGGSPCRVSILRNAYVACLCRLFMPMSHVEFKKCPCRMSNLRNGPVACQYAQCRMSNLRNGHVALSILGV